MDVCESEHALEKQSAAKKKRLPLVPAENKNGVIRQVRTTEVISRYRSTTPSSPTGSKRFPSPFASRTSSTSIASSAPQRATSTERKHSSRPSSPPPPSTPIQDTAAEMLLASRKIAGNKLPESLWPSTMRSLSVSFQSDTISVPVSKKEKPISHMPSDRTLRPSSNVAHRQAEISATGKPTPEKKQRQLKGKNSADQSENSKPERKQSPFRGKNSADQSENSKPERKQSPLRRKNFADQSENSKPGDSMHPRLVDQYRWPSRTTGKVSTVLDRSIDLADKTSKTSSLSHPGTSTPSLRRLSLDGTTKPLIKPTSDFLMLISHDDSGKAVSNGCSVDDKTSKTSSISHSGIGTPSLRRLSLDGTSKPLIKPTNDFMMPTSCDGSEKTVSNGCSVDDKTSKTSSLSHPETGTPSLRRLSLDGTTKPLIKPASDFPTVIPRDESGKAVSNGYSVDDKDPGIGTSSLNRLSLDRTTPLINPTNDFLMLTSRDESGKAVSSECLSSVSSGCPVDVRTSKTSSLSHSGTSTPSLRRLSLDGPTKPLIKSTSDLLMLISGDESGKAVSNGYSKDDKTNKTSSLPHSTTHSLKRLSLDGTTKPFIKPTSDLLMLKPLDESGKAVSSGCSVNDKASKTSSLLHSGTSTPSLRRLSLDGTTKPLTKYASDLIMLKSRDESGKTVSNGCSVADKPSKTSPLPHSETCTPSLRKLSQDGTTEPSIKSTSDLQMLKPLDDSGKAVSSGCSVDDKTCKTSSLPHSETCTPSLRRLSQDGTTEHSVKSTSDLQMLKPLDVSGKAVSIVCSDDDNSLQMQKPGSSTSLDRTQLVNDAARAPSTPTFGLRPLSPFMSRGVSPSRARAITPSSRVPSPVRVRPSSPTRQSHSSTSVLSFMLDIKMGKKTANHIDDVHKLRLLYNRHLQWQFINAQMDTALQSQKVKAQDMVYGVWMAITDLWDSIVEKRIDLQQLRLKLNLYSVLNNQLSFLDEWAAIERDHVNSVTWTMQDAEASIIRIPVSGGAKCDVKTVKAVVCSAVDVMQAIGSSLSSILSRVEGMKCLLSELADVVAQERALLDECELDLGPASELPVEEYSIRSHLLQMKLAWRDGKMSTFGY